MGKDKLQRFAELETMQRVFQHPDRIALRDFGMKGKWHSDVFNNTNPLVLELGCGRGEYTVELAQRYPQKNFIGIDIKGARLWRGAKTINEQQILNAAFLRIRIELIEHFFGMNEVDEIWITFPDPQLHRARENRRLTNKVFLDRYRKFLKPQGIIHLKTDSQELYEYTLDVIRENNCKIIYNTNNLYNGQLPNIDLDIQTTYEGIFQKEGKPITYLCFMV